MDEDNSIQLYVEKQQLNINCLYDPDRNIRLRGVDNLSKNIFPNKTEKADETHIKFLLEKLISPLLNLFNDKIEKIRQMSIELVIKLIENYEIEDKFTSQIIHTIIGRLNYIPFPETSEELRLKLVQVLFKILMKSPNDLIPQISDLSSTIAKCLTDAFPDIKMKLSEFLIEMSQKLNKVLGPHSKGIVQSLCLNLKHQHNKIRKITINALIDILLCDLAGKFIEDAIPILKVISNDKNYDVRKAFYSAIYKLLTNLNIIHLRNYEHLLVMLLMNGLSDEKSDIQENCENFIEQAGEYRKRLAVELEEDLSEFSNDEMIVDRN